MEKNLRFILSALIAASAIFLSASVALFVMRQSEIEKRVAVEKRLEELNKEKARLTKDLDEALVLKNDLEIKLGNVQEKARLLEGQLEEEKKSREAAYLQLEGEKRESRRLVDDLLRLKEEKEQIALSLAGAKSECEGVKTQLSNVQLAKEVLETKLKELVSKKEIELEKIVVNPQAPLPAPQVVETTGKVKGEVLVVNKKFEFVVVNIGENAGITPGMDLDVYRNGQFIASLQVEKVHANMSAAKIPAEASDVDIREGDEVSVK